MAASQRKLSAAVGVSGTSYGFDRRYRYIVPPGQEERAAAGVRVIVPFGKGNRKRMGVILSVDECSGNEAAECKLISSFIDAAPVIGREQTELLIWLRNAVLCTYYEAFRTLIPPGLSVNFKQKYKTSDKRPAEGELSSDAADLLDSLREVKNCREQGMMIESALSGGTDTACIRELIDGGFIEEYDEVKQKVKDDTVSMVRLTSEYLNNTGSFSLSPKQKLVANLLIQEETASVKELCYLCGITSGVVKNMVKNGSAELYEYETITVPDAEITADINGISLNADQQQVFEGISEMISEGKAAAALLFGVTGSGKTPVFAKLIQYTLDMGRNVIMLIPEISLTPQTVNRFRGLFGDTVSVMHSGLSLSMRLNEYKRVKSGQSRIVIGTRSAVFAPLDNIGLIIIDEEGERTYKSESAPRYNAKDVALQRCLYHNAVLLPASATPSIESYYMALKGRSRLFTMPRRYAHDVLPKVEIIDMCETGRIFSEQLIEEINANLERGEQSILLLNRRGYNTYISCTACREPVSCPNCSIPLTYHKANGRLICHYCGYSTEMITACPKCGSSKLKLTGMGTQRLEDEIAEFFPKARILRMDADTTYSRYAYDKRFTAFAQGEYDIMIGTQMIAKGLDFPNVTLVGVLNADKALYSGDFRSYERTFSLITQVVGRCGRGDLRGRALIQTYVPDHYVVRLAADQNYTEFYEQEIAMRRALIYPPFCDVCVVGFSSPLDKCASAAAELFAAMLKEGISSSTEKMPIRVLGPSKCVFERINGKYRYRLIIKCRNNSTFRSFIGDIWKRASKKREFSNVSSYIDINGDISL
ncbi:MAG: primosomal protein N' [Huintestinicola sp.]